MIEEIRVENFALIKDVHLKFHPGFNIIMGETGSGKSSLIDAISILFGSRASKDKIRQGEDTSYLSIVLNISGYTNIINFLKDHNLYADDEPLIITRYIRKNSSTISKINDHPVTAQTLKSLSMYLIDIYGQFDNMLILSSSEQLKFIDKFGDENFKKLKDDYLKSFLEYRYLKDKLEDYDKTPEELARDKEFLEYQIKDIDDSNILNINENDIFSRLDEIENIQDIKTNVFTIIEILTGDNGLLMGLNKIEKLSSELTVYAEHYKHLTNRISGVYIELDDIKSELQMLSTGFDYNPDEFNELDNLRSLIYNMKRKYGPTIEDIHNLYIKLTDELNNINNYYDLIDDLKKNIGIAKDRSYKIGQKLSDIRKQLAKDLESRVLSELSDLDMKDSNFKIKFSDVPLQQDGIDLITFMISFNKSEPLMNFSEVASGGEISRFMLAVKSIEANFDNTPILIFDEIDTGISGNAGAIVANKLKELSKTHIIISISHLPQIIARADYQYLVYKREANNKTYSFIKELNEDQRVKELAKVIQGDNYTMQTLKTAKQMINLVKDTDDE